MLPSINHNYSKDIFSSLGFSSRKKDFFYIPKSKPLKVHEKAEIITGATVGTILPIVMLAKKQKLPLLKLKYSEKEMLILSTGSIAGGITGGIIADKGHNIKNKIHEGVFQFFNAIIPTLMIKPILKICQSIKLLNNCKTKAAMLLGGIFSGMLIGAEVSNKVNGNYTPDKKRNVKFIDSIANIDVIAGALIIAKMPLINKLGIEKLLPLPYIWTGFQSGKTRE